MKLKNKTGGRAGERGLAILVVMAILAILLALVMSNSRTLFLLKRELRQVEQQQLKRLHPRATNQVEQPQGAAQTPLSPP